MEGSPFTNTAIISKSLLADGPAGNRWYKVNLHVHAENQDPAEVVKQARAAAIDLLAITDHQTFNSYEAVLAAAKEPGRALVVLPGIEITAHEGVHLLAVFTGTFDQTQRGHFIGWLDIPGTGDTRVGSKKNILDILKKVNDLGGTIIAPHPFTDDIGILAAGPKVETRARWLDSGFIHLMQVSDNAMARIKFIGHDESGNWINRYVLKSASRSQIESSTYSIAPFNRSDAHKPEEISDGCSWFRMAEPSVEGLKQVACEPRTRISRREPIKCTHDCILAVRVEGGYCDGEFFSFNEGLNCLIGPNHAGKSAVLDFIRFTLQHDDADDADARRRLLRRLYAILEPGGKVEVFVQQRGRLVVVRREFDPTEGSEISCQTTSNAYEFNAETSQFDPIDDFSFPIEVYEQGRINKLRNDVDRQLDMLDDFANVSDLKNKRSTLISDLKKSANKLAPLLEERDELTSSSSELAELKKELAEKEKHLPGEDEARWATASGVVENLSGVAETLADVAQCIPDPDDDDRLTDDDLDQLFAQELPDFDSSDVVQSKLLEEWQAAVQTALTAIESARVSIGDAVRALARANERLQKKWDKCRSGHDHEISEKLAKIGVESPKEIIRRVRTLRSKINDIENVKKPRLKKIKERIDKLTLQRSGLIQELREVQENITTRRKEKAEELTETMDDNIKVTIDLAANREEYRSVLNAVCTSVTHASLRLRNRDEQLGAVVRKLKPLDLTDFLENGGSLKTPEKKVRRLRTTCGITENTETVLCTAAKDIRLLNKLQSVIAEDIPRIEVRRRGETIYADLATGLSPGEQSAAILTLALQTRAMPLILDQPEDELGYSYVVHLIVPKVLEAKFSRQLLAVTHNANLAVLGDADYIIRMDNRPLPGGGRQCVAAAAGCFEQAPITNALLELEGGQRAFQFRQHRYSIPFATR